MFDRLLRLAAAAPAILLALAQPATAQSMVVMERDIGSGPQVMAFSMPDFSALRIPDYVRDDVPTFVSRLELDDAQGDTVTAQIEAYLEKFNALAGELLPKQFQGDVQRISFGDGTGEGLTLDLSPAGNAMFDPDDLPEGGSFSVGVMIGNGGNIEGEDVDVVAGGGGDGGPSVFVAVESADGELPEELREKLQERAEQMAEEMQRQMEEGGGMATGDPAAMEARMAERAADMEELAESARKFEIEKTALRKAFELGVQGELATEQLERWPALERTLVRRKTLPSGQLTGESADLIAVLERLDVVLDPASPIGEQALAYELELHDALVRRNTYVGEAQTKVDEALSNGDGQTALELVERSSQLRSAVRDINKRYASTMAQVIGSRMSEFEAEARQALWSRVYRQTRAERAFEQARKLEGIGEEKLLQVLELESAFRAELDRVNTQLVRTIDREEPLQRVRSMERIADSMSGIGEPGTFEFGNDPVHKAFGERRAFERRTMKQLYALFTPEQVEMLPKIRDQNEQPFRFQFGGGQQDN